MPANEEASLPLFTLVPTIAETELRRHAYLFMEGRNKEADAMSKRLAAIVGTGIVLLLAAGVTALAGGGSMGMGPSSSISRPAFHGYYDGHKVTYLSTDVSSKAQAKALHINYSALIGKVKGSPEIYLVIGKAAPGQLAIFGSEPGESNYSPLWTETDLTWKAGATPVPIKSDTQINQLEKKGVLTEKPGGAVLNCPIIKIGS